MLVGGQRRAMARECAQKILPGHVGVYITIIGMLMRRVMVTGRRGSRWRSGRRWGLRQKQRGEQGLMSELHKLCLKTI